MDKARGLQVNTHTDNPSNLNDLQNGLQNDHLSNNVLLHNPLNLSKSQPDLRPRRKENLTVSKRRSVIILVSSRKSYKYVL